MNFPLPQRGYPKVVIQSEHWPQNPGFPDILCVMFSYYSAWSDIYELERQLFSHCIYSLDKLYVKYRI